MATVVLIGALPESLPNFRGDLIRAMVAAGHSVTAMSTPTTEEQVRATELLGARGSLYNGFLAGKLNWQYHFWDVLMFQAWLAVQKA